ncbi:hypothetical protein LJR066_000609 [Acidovorax sp. LjRoot66]|uniref:RCC1 domain-containing protein n=1 Tax=Acidovorax sp. LjRoot66 TaxID=3342334 RepID=UPI003ED08955
MLHYRLKAFLGALLAVIVTLPASAVTISAGETHTCAVSSAGKVFCWGLNADGEIGDGSRQDRPDPVPVSGLDSIVTKDVRVGRNFSCSLADDNTVRCWGAINPTQTKSDYLGLTNVLQITAGSSHACSLVSSGDVFCWGDASQGQLGAVDVGSIQGGKAAKIPELSGAKKISAGKNVTCVVLLAGQVGCIGSGSQLPGASSSPNEFRLVPAVNDAVDVSTYDGHTCLVRVNGVVACWGKNDFGQAGSQQSVGSNLTEISGLESATSVAAGKGFTCALLTNNKISCWGSNANGELGVGNEVRPSKYVIGINSARSVSAGANHACAVIEEGSYIQCWGNNQNGRLGTGQCYTNNAFYPGYSGAPYFDSNLGQCINSKAITPYSVKGFDASADAEKVLLWAEKSFPAILGKGDEFTYVVSREGYFFRKYNNGANLAITANGTPKVFYFGPDSNWQLVDLGALSQWVAIAK